MALKATGTFHDAQPIQLTLGYAPEGTPPFVAAAGELLNIDYEVKDGRSARKGKWTHAAGDHGRGGKKTKAPWLAWAMVKGKKKGRPVIVEPPGSDFHFRSTHGLMG